MFTPSVIQIIGASLFALAILHTFSTQFFERLAQTRPAHAGLWHLLGEVEVVFGFWAFVFAALMLMFEGSAATLQYMDSRNFTEPMFVFAIMVIAATRPILQTATHIVHWLARAIPLPTHLAFCFTVLAFVPLLGSFITEPAAMTLAALILADSYFKNTLSNRLKYALLGVLFVNISIGGTLTPFAAPPVLMVARTWNWDIGFMLATFGWKGAIAVVVNALGLVLLFRRELGQLPLSTRQRNNEKVPFVFAIIHLAILVAVVVWAHHAAVFMGLFVLFLGIANAYPRYENKLILREGLLVAVFLAGLVVLGGQQQWWLEPILMAMNNHQVFLGATFLTAFTDNAALTYLGSQVEGLSDSFKYALVSGAVVGGGLTMIANAPNPAGIAILSTYFEAKAVHPIRLLLAAILPTIVAALAFKLL